MDQDRWVAYTKTFSGRRFVFSGTQAEVGKFFRDNAGQLDKKPLYTGTDPRPIKKVAR